MREKMIEKNFDFHIPDFLQKDIQILIDANNNPDLITVDCEQENLYATINMALSGKLITDKQARLLRHYYLRGGWLWNDFYSYEVEKELKTYVRMVLALRKIPFHKSRSNEEDIFYLELNQEAWKEIVDRAICMKRTEETGILHVTEKESHNEEFLYALKFIHHTNSYTILS